MSENPYSKRELDSHFQNMKELFNEHQRDDNQNFGEIKTILRDLTGEVRKTNGSVKGLQLWRSYIVGGLSVLSLIVVPVAIYILTHPL